MTSLNRLTRLARMTRRPILGVGKNGKMVKPVGSQRNGKMLKPSGPEIDASVNMVKLTSAKKW